MIKSPVLSALCAVAFVGPSSAQFLADEKSPKQILTKLKELHLGDEHRAGSVPSAARVSALQRELSTIYQALPKNHRGALRPSTARYALHRLFVDRHGWHFTGLAPKGDTWDSSSPTSALGRVPEDVSRLFQSQLTQHGLDLHDLATLAAVMENMVHSEADVRLAASFDALRVPLDQSLSVNESMAILEIYMASFVMGSDAQQLSRSKMFQKLDDVHEQYPTWPNTVSFVQQIRQEVAPGLVNFTFSQLSAVVAAAGERYGRWQSQECSELKHQLLQQEEHPNTGRVRLSDFYAMAVRGGHWQFSESVAYLRRLGALDESDPKVMRVIVPNYILGPSNCIASSGYVAVCCIDECEAKMRSLEEQLGTHEATVPQILGSLNRSSVVPPALRRKLQDVAQHHGGQVPLHGRLFQQWMHHAYPQECPFPHMSGTIHPLHPELFEEQVGEPVGASQEEMLQHVEGASWKKAPDFEEGLCSRMWTMEEELVDPTPRADGPVRLGAGGRLGAAARGLALALAVSSLAVTMAKIVTSMRPTSLKPTASMGAAARIYSV
ncbi:unnamed protein product [Durusdinium trenchii]|uniref:Uncharacterized protein n=1 Tax=Durusdinium trenchii TaxID=1381693 RepID=A0ABP0SUY4_9DINO